MNLILKRTILFCAALVFSAAAYANVTSTRAGCMSMQGVTGNLYAMEAQLLVTVYPDSADEVELDWGDGNVQTEQMLNFAVTSAAHGFIISIYATHAYSPGYYTTYLRAGNRVPCISNIPSSDTTRFGLVGFLSVDPFFGCDGGPETDSSLLEIDMPVGLVTRVSMGAVDAQGDSVHWMLSSPLGGAGYVYPDVTGGGGFVQYPDDTSFEWDPQYGGLYAVMVAYSDYKLMPSGNWIAIGISSREILLNAGDAMAVDELSRNALAVYPNPADDMLYLSAPQECVELLNAQGQVVFSASQTNALNVSALPAGVYFLRTTDGVQEIVVK